MLSKELKQIIKEIKKEFLDEKIKTNQDIKDDIKENKNLYDTKMIMFKTFGVSNNVYNEFYNYSLIMREFKNKLSKIFYKYFYDILKREFAQIDTEFLSLKQHYKGLITNSKNFQDAYKEVKAMYQAIIAKHFKWSNKQATLSYLTKFYSADLKNFLFDKLFTEGLEPHQLKAFKLLIFDEKKVEKIIFNICIYT